MLLVQELNIEVLNMKILIIPTKNLFVSKLEIQFQLLNLSARPDTLLPITIIYIFDRFLIIGALLTQVRLLNFTFQFRTNKTEKTFSPIGCEIKTFQWLLGQLNDIRRMTAATAATAAVTLAHLSTEWLC